jgi:hypothetical protein
LHHQLQQEIKKTKFKKYLNKPWRRNAQNMKKLITTIAIALLVSAFSVSNVNAAEDIKNPDRLSRPLAVGAYQVGNEMKLTMLVEKHLGEKAMVKITDENKNVLYRESIGKNTLTYKFAFDMSELPAGNYSVEIVTGNEKITKEVLRGNNTLSY